MYRSGFIASLVVTLRSNDADDIENVKKNNRFNKQNNNFARASLLFVHFFPVFARLRRENAQFRVEIQLQEGSPTFHKVSG